MLCRAKVNKGTTDAYAVVEFVVVSPTAYTIRLLGIIVWIELFVEFCRRVNL